MQTGPRTKWPGKRGTYIREQRRVCGLGAGREFVKVETNVKGKPEQQAEHKNAGASSPGARSDPSPVKGPDTDQRGGTQRLLDVERQPESAPARNAHRSLGNVRTANEKTTAAATASAAGMSSNV